MLGRIARSHPGSSLARLTRTRQSVVPIWRFLKREESLLGNVFVRIDQLRAKYMLTGADILLVFCLGSYLVCLGFAILFRPSGFSWAAIGVGCRIGALAFASQVLLVFIYRVVELAEYMGSSRRDPSGVLEQYLKLVADKAFLVLLAASIFILAWCGAAYLVLKDRKKLREIQKRRN